MSIAKAVRRCSFKPTSKTDGVSSCVMGAALGRTGVPAAGAGSEVARRGAATWTRARGRPHRRRRLVAPDDATSRAPEADADPGGRP